ncbi:MAG: hypothetical protein AAGN66_28380 [Acidobacteriota bacterium]
MDEARGPQGGKTTVRGDKIRKTFWLLKDEVIALRLIAARKLSTEAAVIGELIRREAGLDDAEDP